MHVRYDEFVNSVFLPLTHTITEIANDIGVHPVLLKKISDAGCHKMSQVSRTDFMTLNMWTGQLTMTKELVQHLKMCPFNTPDSHVSDLRLWFTYLVKSIEQKIYRHRKLPPFFFMNSLNMYPTDLLWLFPQHGPDTSVAVTRGIEVRCATKFNPFRAAWMYCIRVRILDPNEIGG